MKSNVKKKKKSSFRRFLRIQVYLILFVLAALMYYFFGGKAAQIKTIHDEALRYARRSGESTFKASLTSVVYDKDGNEITSIKGEKDVYYLCENEIPNYVKEAFVNSEDKNFYKHKGVDFKAVVRAGIDIIKNREITQGASTITMQLARNVFLSQEVTWERKMEEIFIAIELEKMYTKGKILEFYINNIYFANGYYGIGAACKGYFNTDISSLSLSQIAFLCAIPNNPTLYNPVDNFDNTIKRRDRLLEGMQKDGIISMEQLNTAKNEQIVLNLNDISTSNYVETYTYYCATRKLMEAQGFKFRYDFKSVEDEMNYSEEYSSLYSQCQMSLFTGGLRIYTSIDINKQNLLQDTLNNVLSQYNTVNEENVYQLQGSATCINNDTGLVEAIVGGRKQDEIKGYTLNRAYQCFRQPGSSIKPLIVYTPAFELGYTPNDTVADVKTENGPKNGDGTYLGNISIRTAIELSKNTVAWNLLNDISPQIGLSYIKKMNFEEIKNTDYTDAAALGGLTKGVSSLEMTKAFSTIENDGVYREASDIVKITDAQGNIIVDKNQEEIQVYKKDACDKMTDCLRGVLTKGTAKGYAFEGMDIAGKTGTTNDNKDGWFVGYSHYYTTGVWVGYDIPQTLPGSSASRFPLTIWYNFMKNIHQGLENVELASWNP
ncbi:Membrane carboxypeptidase (penicillin-binding protein) [Acetitomaculum ruminis DSM 5522]|uniref:Penicillin-binding protein 1A n=1 Tax=Acetitomaculum ruminis DSM 5522 TaxID=1120918 RepID=A0A1I0WY46_9FIRM|nr:transglycosylase domain-containing protein [Acetitomaculum ruminis]SFA93702.1 Membrane carboxypeptidase (penicillin-binding protein) [Acetitomaculum ruminis DSM 5522]